MMSRVSEPFDFTDDAAERWLGLFPEEELLEYQVVLRLIRGGRIASEALQAAAERYELSVAGDFEVLAALRRSDPSPLRPQDLAERLMVSAAAVTGRLDRLESAGLIERTLHPTDRRSWQVSLTPQGAEVADGGFKTAVAEMQQLLSAIPQRELEHFSACLRQVLIALADVPAPEGDQPSDAGGR